MSPESMSAAPEPDPRQLGGRLTLRSPSDLDPDERSLYDYLASTKVGWATKSGFKAELSDGRLIGPFNVFLKSPKLSRAYNGWVDAETESTSLAADVRQVIILTVGAAWGASYEIYAHRAVGHAVGLPDTAMAIIVAGAEPTEISPAARAAYRFTRALVSDKAVSDLIYSDAAKQLGEHGVSDMVHLIGLYLATSALLNAFMIPAPD